MDPLSNSAIADTVAAVLRSRDFVVHDSVSIGQLITEWIWNLVLRFLGFATSHPAIGLVLKLTLGAIALVILGRIGYGLLARYSPSALGRQHLESARGTDWWQTAQRHASDGDYTAAAHALYLALLGSAARRGLVSLHESKTTGDYLREVRRRPDAIDLPGFVDFTRSYETVIYGIGICDQERYSRLSNIAGALLGVLPGSDDRHSRTRHAIP
ncbi:MAG: DUF4129 domain-containing protein [Gemmatimonadaceae bacterium]